MINSGFGGNYILMKINSVIISLMKWVLIYVIPKNNIRFLVLFNRKIILILIFFKFKKIYYIIVYGNFTTLITRVPELTCSKFLLAC